MPFDYDRVTGPIDQENDPEAVRMYKASTGALAYALFVAGWSKEQIANGLRTHFDAASAVLAEYLIELKDTDTAEARNPMWEYTAAEITPLPRADHCQCFRCPKCPCRPDYCNACVPERT
jgi:hypothetical protein